jgi:hypothetical protein
VRELADRRKSRRHHEQHLEEAPTLCRSLLQVLLQAHQGARFDSSRTDLSHDFAEVAPSCRVSRIDQSANPTLPQLQQLLGA